MMAIPSDEFLLAAFAKGDRAAFDRLAARYSDALDGFFRRRLPDDGRVEELRQETLLAIYSLLPSYWEQGKFRTLVFSIAYRKLASAFRAAKPAEPLSEAATIGATAPEVFEIRDAVHGLPEALREALLLTRIEGLSASEAGEVLGCSGEAVRARVCRARGLLARKLGTGSRRKR
jgi:RNA polymerase sigma-70 factor (ECF subfamily)